MKELVEKLIYEAVEDGYMAATPARRPAAKAIDAAKLQPFQIESIKNLKTPEEVINYINATQLKNALVGEGSSRLVYKYSEQYALKVAKNSGSGVAQNQAEQNACTTEQTKHLFTKVAEVGPGSIWLLVEFAAAINEQIFEKKTGISFQDFGNALVVAIPGSATVKQANKDSFNKIANNQFFKNIVITIRSCRYEPGDLAKMDSWGITPDGRLVIVDSGFTEAVNMAFYKNLPATKK